MPAQQARPVGFSFASSARKHAKDKTDYGQDFTRLPGGVSHGTARLDTATIGTYKQGALTGKKFVRFMGVALTPETVVDEIKEFKNGKVVTLRSETKKVAGLQTSVMFPLCDSVNAKGEVTRSADDNAAELLNELRKLGGDDYTEPLESAKTEDEAFAILGKLLEGLQEEAPVFEFSTRRPEPNAQYPTTRVFEQWWGRVKEQGGGPTDAAAGVDDGSGETKEPFNEFANDAPADDTAAGDDGDAGEEVDLDALAGRADPPTSETAAQEQLERIAVENGIAQTDIDGATSWAAVVEMIHEATGGGDEATAEEEEAPAEEEPFVPVKGTVYNRTVPKDPKNPKKGTKKVEVEVLTVNEKNQTVTIKDNTTKKTVMDASGKKALAVPFADLTP